MTDPTTPPPPPGPTGQAVGSLRRSSTDRILTGVAGGLGEYFAVDPVIFRVLFAVLSFFGGVGVLLYLACWLLLPETGSQPSVLDRAIAALRARRVPPWLVIIGGALALWAGWFSWWAPGPTFPALVVIAVLLIVLIRRLAVSGGGSALPPGWVGGSRPHAPYPWQQARATWQQATGPAGPGVTVDETAAAESTGTDATLGDRPTVDLSKAGQPTVALPPADWFSEPLVAPLNDTRRSMSAWYTEAREAQRARRARRRPVRVILAVVLLIGLAMIGILDAVNRLSFGVYLWFVLSVLAIGFLTSLALRRTLWELIWPILLFIPLVIALGATPASLTDGSGRTGWVPTSAAALSNERQFAGDTTLDLTQLPTLTEARSVSVTQAAGRVVIRIPRTANVAVTGAVHFGDVQLGSSHDTGDFVAGMNTSLTVPSASATGPQLTVTVHLTVGHIQIDRVG